MYSMYAALCAIIERLHKLEQHSIIQAQPAGQVDTSIMITVMHVSCR